MGLGRKKTPILLTSFTLSTAMAKEVRRVPFLEPDNMKKLGFDLLSDDGTYVKYENDGTKHYNTDYNKQFPEPKGKVVFYVNFEYGQSPYIEIRQDGDSRKAYGGICPDEDFLVKLLYSIR